MRVCVCLGMHACLHMCLHAKVHTLTYAGMYERYHHGRQNAMFTYSQSYEGVAISITNENDLQLSSKYLLYILEEMSTESVANIP